MNKYLVIENFPYEGESFHSFECEDGLEVVRQKFAEHQKNPDRFHTPFYGIPGYFVAESEVVTLEEFWESRKRY